MTSPPACSAPRFLSRLGPVPGRSLTDKQTPDQYRTARLQAGVQVQRSVHILNMATSLTRQQVKLSKSMVSLSAYRATSIWYNLLFSLNPEKQNQSPSEPANRAGLKGKKTDNRTYRRFPAPVAFHRSSCSQTYPGQTP